MKNIVVIPARAKSTRFPNKPLVSIHGKPMVFWVFNNAAKAVGADNVLVATESEEIARSCHELGINAIITRDCHETGTDRVCEISDSVCADNYIILMGDEPLISSEHIKKLISNIGGGQEFDAAMLCTKYIEAVDVINPSTIKLAINDAGELVYISRAPIPYPKGRLNFSYYKNMGCYSFSKGTLDIYKRNKPGVLESIEEIELLRLVELRKKVLCVEVDSDSFSIDTSADLQKLKSNARFMSRFYV